MSNEKFESLAERIDHLTHLVESAIGDIPRKTELNPQARYRLHEAASYLGVSESTLRRRANVGKITVFYDGATPFVSGSELLRYAREGARRGSRRRRPRTSTSSNGGA